MTDNSLCTCGSTLPSEECCTRILSGTKKAETAEELMRSRYTAFFKRDVNYLLATQDPSQGVDTDAMKQSCESSYWLSLQVLSTSAGQSDDSTGQVEFIAFYTEKEQDQVFQLHELSNFIKQDGQWLYLNQDWLKQGPLNISRNAKCWCGSGKKFKKCHN